MITSRRLLLSRHSGVIMHVIMADPLRISLRYRGPEVDNGEMEMRDVIEALQGFSGAFGKVANDVSPDASYQLKIVALERNSFDLFIVALMGLAQRGDVIKQIETLTDAARYVYGLIVDVIKIKKHTKGHPFEVNVKGNNNPVTIINAEKMEMNFPIQSFELFKSGLIDRDLGKIVDPLRLDRINIAELKAENEPSAAPAEITAAEKEYFRESKAITLKETELIGTLVSLNKESNRGLFKFGDNSGVRYHYVGEHVEEFHRDFAKKGPVKVSAVVEFDGNLKPLHMEIKSVQPLQEELKLS